ncbi:AAA family ATPase [Lignipirellula cremea]|uniref:Septum site-determining protein MinD n=1 Tax=Lignipirellula cremea TaxID=2528010 RepID=A0A518E1J2_9BACT|nr:AAA family ATPase [Lignipirellula cremea]QDU97959.1 Septum site-determining protein MinD [Lignipirellula cremea]
MSHVLRLAIVDPNDATRDNLKSTLLGMDMVWLEAECSRYEFFSDVVDQTHPDIALVNLDSDPKKALTLMGELRSTSPECAILVVSSSTDGQLILQSMRAGAKEFLTQPLGVEELVGALERIGSQRTNKKGGKTRSCKMIAICGSTGGVGTTSLAVNLGCALAMNPVNTVALVDLDLSLGDADVFLDAIPDYTLVDVAQNITRLDFTLLKRSLTKHSSGLYLLPRPVQLQDTALVTAEDLQRVFGLLKATFSHLIIDCSKGYNALDMVALESSTHVLLVTQLDLPCLRNVVRLMMSFDEYDKLKEKVKIVVNRVGLGNGQISLKKAQETVGSEIYWQLPNDYRVMVEVRNNGVPLVEQAPRAGITQSIIALGDSLCGVEERSKSEEEEPASKKAGWLGFLGSKTKK